MKIGDFVFSDEGDVWRISTRQEAAEGKEYNWPIVTIADAFALAGHPVPEGREIHWQQVRSDDDKHYEFYQIWQDDGRWMVAPFRDGEWLYRDNCWQSSPVVSPALSRLPVSDAFDALPELVQKALVTP